MTEAQKIGARIKELRERNNLTQQELAHKLQYKSRSTINKIELGINEIHPTKIRTFAYVLNTTPQYILGWTDDANVCENTINIVTSDNKTYQFLVPDNKIKQILDFINSTLEQK